MVSPLLEERLERLCDRFNIPEPWRSLTLSRFANGCERYGTWNHLRMTVDELDEERLAEAADLLAFILLIPWSRAYYRSWSIGDWLGLEEEELVDEAINADLVDALMDALRLLKAADEADSTPQEREVINGPP